MLESLFLGDIDVFMCLSDVTIYLKGGHARCSLSGDGDVFSVFVSVTSQLTRQVDMPGALRSGCGQWAESTHQEVLSSSDSSERK